MVYGDFKHLNRRAFADKVLCNKAFNIAKDPKHDGYQRALASMVYKFFDKKTPGKGIKNENTSKKKVSTTNYQKIEQKVYLKCRFSRHGIDK